MISTTAALVGVALLGAPAGVASQPPSSPPAGSAGEAALPGGTAGLDVLENAGIVDDEGVVVLGPAPDPDDDTVETAMCEYIFGSGDEVAATANLDEDVVVVDGSGFSMLGGGGTGIACGYGSDIDGDPEFVAWLWTDQRDTENWQHVVWVADGANGWHGITAYHPEYTGEPIATATAEAWLYEASARLVVSV